MHSALDNLSFIIRINSLLILNLLVQSNVKDIQYPNYLVQEHILAFIRINPGNKQAISCD